MYLNKMYSYTIRGRRRFLFFFKFVADTNCFNLAYSMLIDFYNVILCHSLRLKQVSSIVLIKSSMPIYTMFKYDLLSHFLCYSNKK